MKEALAQPEREFVAWRTALERIADPRNTHFGNDARVVAKSALDTTPPQRTWVGLTDDEIMDIYNEPRSDAEMIAFGREVEAKLKEKNA